MQVSIIDDKFPVHSSRLTALLWLLADETLDYSKFEVALKQCIQDADETMWYSTGICLKDVNKLERYDFAVLAKKRVVSKVLHAKNRFSKFRKLLIVFRVCSALCSKLSW